MYWCESWTLKKAAHWKTDAFKLWCWRRLLRVPYCKEIKSINPKGNQPWIVIGRTRSKAEAPILQQSDAESRLIGKDPDAGEDWRPEEKGVTQDEMVGWHGHEFEQTLGDIEGQGSLECCRPWGRKESDTAEWTTTNTHNARFTVIHRNEISNWLWFKTVTFFKNLIPNMEYLFT